MYDPQIGQWLSEDPIDFEGLDANLRRYVGNHPTYATDPRGTIETKTGEVPEGTPENGYNGIIIIEMPDYLSMFDAYRIIAKAAGWRWTFTAGMQRQAERGCVGLAMMRFGYFIYNGASDKIRFPTQIDDAKVFDSEKAAKDYWNSLEDKENYRVFAYQLAGNAKIVRNPENDGKRLPGQLFDGELFEDAAAYVDGATYNWATWHQVGDSGYWEYMEGAFQWDRLNWPKDNCPKIYHTLLLPEWANPKKTIKYTLTVYGVAPIKK